MIGIFASGTTASWVAKIGTKKTSKTLQFSITILHYLVAEIDYKLFMLFYRVMKIEGVVEIYIFVRSVVFKKYSPLY